MFKIPEVGGIFAVSLFLSANCIGFQHSLRESAISRLEEALADTHKLSSVIQKVDLLQDAAPVMKNLPVSLDRQVISETFEAIASSPSVIEQQSNVTADRPPSVPVSKRTEDRDNVFGRFIKAVGRYDASLVKEYVKRYGEIHKNSPSSVYLWSMASDLLADDAQGSLRFAAAAAQSDDFPDAGLLYLDRLRSVDPAAADALATRVISRMSAFSANQRLNLLTYVFAFARAPEIDGTSLFDKDVADGTLMPGNGLPSSALIGNYVSHLVLAQPATSAPAQFMLLDLLRTKLHDAYPEMENKVQAAELALSREISAVDKQKASEEVQRWLHSDDALVSSIDRSDLAYKKLGDEKYRNRSTLLKALEQARAGNYDSALGLLSALPADSRIAATDAVLLYAANAVKSPDQSSKLRATARSSTRTPFVLAYTLLQDAKLISSQPRFPFDEVTSEVNELEQLAQQVNLPAQRYSLRLGAAALWTRLNNDRAYSEVLTLVRDIGDETNITGTPLVHMILSVSGTYMEFDIPAGDSNLYYVVKRLALKKFDETIAIASSAKSDEIRLRCIVAACAPYLETENRRKIK